jgi:N-acetylneuraminate synthase
MSTLDEIQRTYDALVPMGVPIAFTNCLSEYPPKYEDVNLNVIKKMKERFPLATIGHSDHTPDLYTCYAAVALGATMIEKHVILSKQTPGPDQSVSIDFHDLYCLCDGIHKVEKALGDEKVVHENEKAIREWAFRSIVTKCKINKGETIESSMIWSKRPGTGIPSHKMNDVIGKKAIHDIDENVLLKYEDFE